jgi:tripartite ATP-independent transporter DctM subunit
MLFMIIGVPITFTIGIVSTGLLLIKGYPLALIPHMMTTGVESWVLLAVPFFILVGQLMNYSKLSEKIYDFATAAVGHLVGSLGHVNIVASIIFAGVSGAALADVQGLGVVEIKAMTEKGYDKPFSAAITAASSTIGPIIPPSIPMVIYAAIAEVSVAKLFLAGFIPGIFMGLSMMIFVYFIAKKRKFPVFPKATLKQFIASFISAIPALIIPSILLGSIIFGIATPTEIGVIAIFYILFVIGIIYKDLSWQDVWKAVKQTVSSTSSILIILATASVYGKVLTMEQIPQIMTNFILQYTHNNPLMFLLALNILLLFLGCFLDNIAVMVIIVPIIVPIASALGINEVHLGVIVVFNLMLGLLTPPFGLVLYAICDMVKISMLQMTKEIMPFFLALLLVLFLITFSPKLVLLLPNLIK